MPVAPPAHYAPDLAPFWDFWRQERFWACHEALEDAWRVETAPRKWFLGGLINGAVAVFQHRRGNCVGAARQLHRARVKLEGFVPTYEGMDVAAFLEGIAAEVAPSLARLTPGQRASLDLVERDVRSRISGSDERLSGTGNL